MTTQPTDSEAPSFEGLMLEARKFAHALYATQSYGYMQQLAEAEKVFCEYVARLAAVPAAPPDMPVAQMDFYLGGPYHDGNYSICEVATGRVRHKFNPTTDDHHIEGDKYRSRGVNTRDGVEQPAARTEVAAPLAVQPTVLRMLTSDEIDLLRRRWNTTVDATEAVIEMFMEVNNLSLGGSAGEGREAARIDLLERALVHATHIGHGTPQHMLPQGVCLFDSDGVSVKLPTGETVFAGRTPEYERRRAALASTGSAVKS